MWSMADGAASDNGGAAWSSWCEDEGHTEHLYYYYTHGIDAECSLFFLHNSQKSFAFTQL